MRIISRLVFLTRSPACRLREPLFSTSKQRFMHNSQLYYRRLEPQTIEKIAVRENSRFLVPRESAFYHSVLEGDPKYTDTLVKSNYFDSLLEDIPAFNASLEDSIANLDFKYVCPLFADVTRKIQSQELDVNSDQLMMLASYIKTNRNLLTGDDIRKLLGLLYLWPVSNKLAHKPLKTIILALDTACVSYTLKSKNTPIEDILHLMEMWHWLNLCSISEFMQMATGKLFWRVEKHGHIVQLLLYMGELRTLPSSYDKPALEKKVARFMRYFKPNEIGILAAGFFKTKTKITNYALYKQIMKRVIKDQEKFDDICLNAVLKLLRSSVLTFKEKEDIEAIQQVISPRIPSLSGITLIQFAMLGTTMEVNDRSTMMSVLENLSKYTSELREKDFQRLMYACAVSMDENDISSFVNEIVEEVYKRELPTLHLSEEANVPSNHKKLVCFIEIVLYLHIMGYRSAELIESAIQTGLVLNVNPKETAALQHLDAIVDILFPDYMGPRLDEEKKKMHHEAWFPGANIVFPAKHWFSFEWREVKPERLRLLYLDVCNAVGDDKCVGCHCILPLYEHKDLVLCQDKAGNFVPIPATFGSEHRWEAKRPVEAEDKTFVVLMLLRDRSKNGVPDYTMYQRLRRELLEKLGYRVAVVRYNVFDDMPKDAKSALILDAVKAVE